MIHTEVAAGCVVIQMGQVEPEVLLIWTKQYPDPTLPKGHVEAGESLVDCAVREVKEETGYTVEVINSTPILLEKVMDKHPPVVRKRINWYLASAIEGSPSERTEKSLISKVAWVPLSHALQWMQRPDEIEALQRCVGMFESYGVDCPETHREFAERRKK